MTVYIIIHGHMQNSRQDYKKKFWCLAMIEMERILTKWNSFKNN